MALKKINIKKSELTLTSLTVIFLITIAIFTAGFLYMNYYAGIYGATVDSKYSDAYNKLNESTSTLDDNLQEIKESADKITEAESTAQTAWNGLKLVGSTLILPIKLVDVGTGVFEAIYNPLDVIPSWFKTLIGIGIIATILFLVLAVISGGNTKLS